MEYQDKNVLEILARQQVTLSKEIKLEGDFSISYKLRPLTFDNFSYFNNTSSSSTVFGHKDLEHISFYSPNVDIPLTTPLLFNDWNRLVLVRESGVVRFYKDAEEIASATRTNTFSFTKFGDTSPGLSLYMFEGLMCDIHFFKRALTLDEIDSISNKDNDDYRIPLEYSEEEVFIYYPDKADIDSFFLNNRL